MLSGSLKDSERRVTKTAPGGTMKASEEGRIGTGRTALLAPQGIGKEQNVAWAKAVEIARLRPVCQSCFMDRRVDKGC